MLFWRTTTARAVFSLMTGLITDCLASKHKGIFGVFCLDEAFQLQNCITLMIIIKKSKMYKYFVILWWVTYKVEIVTNF